MSTKELTDRQKLFASEYAACLNASLAATRAGYTGTEQTLRVTGHKLLKLPHVRAAINGLLEQRSFTSQNVIDFLGEQALADIADYLDENGLPDFKKAAALGVTHLIKKMSWRDGQIVGLELHDQQQALIHIGKALGTFTDTLNHTGKIEVDTFQMLPNLENFTFEQLMALRHQENE